MENQSKIIKLNNQEVQVLPYLPIKQKAVFVTYVAENSFVGNENGVKVFDPIERLLSSFYGYIKFYTSYEFEEDADLYDIYDQFVSSGDYEYVLDSIPKVEIEMIENMIDDAIEEKKRELFDLPTIIGKFLDKLILKIPDEKSINKLIKSAGKELKNISPENMELLKTTLGQNNIGVKKK